MQNEASTIVYGFRRVNGMRAGLLMAVLCLLVGSPVGEASVSGIYGGQGLELAQPEAVLNTMRERGATELPAVALAYYHTGLAAADAGDLDKAILNFNLAIELDPGFPESHLALARVHLFRQPQAAVQDFGRAITASLDSFATQHLLLTNVVFGIFLLLGFGGLLFILYLGMLYLPRVHHAVSENLRNWIPGPFAAALGAAFLIAPFFWGVGWIPLILLLAGLMWFWMSRGEQRWVGTVASLTLVAPLLIWVLSPLLYSPLDPGERPFLLTRAMAAPYSTGLQHALEDLEKEYPQDPHVHFALGLIHKRGGHFVEARRYYEDALRLGEKAALVHNNMGVVAFLEGDYDEAMSLLQESTVNDDNRASTHFNLSQTYAKKLYFEKADQALLKANSLSFKRVRATLRHSEGDDSRTMIDEPLEQGVFWATAWAGKRRMPTLPEWMAGLFPGAFMLLPVVCAFTFFLGMGLGRKLYRHLPTFSCTNCARPVCRRCLQRIRREPYCGSCGDALLAIQSSSYSKLVLDSRIRRNRRGAAIASQVSAWIFPGLHLLRAGYPTPAAFICLATTVGFLGLAHLAVPVSRMAWVENTPGLWWPEFPVGLLILVLVASGLTVTRVKARAKNEDDLEDGEELPFDDDMPMGGVGESAA